MPEGSFQVADKRLWQTDKTRDPKFARCQSGRMRNRLLLTTSFKRL